MLSIKIVLLGVFIITVSCLTSDEIEEITKKIDNELLKLKEKKSADNDQHADVVTKETTDESKTKLLVKETQSVLKNQNIVRSKEYENTLNELLRHIKKTSVKEKKEAVRSEKQKAADDALLHAIIDNEIKKQNQVEKQTPVTSGVTSSEADEHLIQIILEEEKKKSVKKEAEENDAEKHTALTNDILQEDLIQSVIQNDDIENRKRTESEDELLKAFIADDLVKQDSHKRDVEVVFKEEECFDSQGASTCETLYKPYCKTHRHLLSTKCSKTCGYCVYKKQEKCEDKAKLCAFAKEKNYCLERKLASRMKTLCKKSCGYCTSSSEAPSPPACQNHPDGCCWDGVSFMKDGCNLCEDNSQINKLCTSFASSKLMRSECENPQAPGIYMRQHCPVSCKQCDPSTVGCFNHKKFNDNLCTDKTICDTKIFRLKYCRKSCGCL